MDVPEVSLVAILDADKEGFLRSERPLIQTIGRAARNQNGEVIMYADKITKSMKIAIDETHRRREIQEAYNEKHHITPKTIIKPIRDVISVNEKSSDKSDDKKLTDFDFSEMTKDQKQALIGDLTTQMEGAAQKLDFETAANLRDAILELQGE